jgi:hypothetical protein
MLPYIALNCLEILQKSNISSCRFKELEVSKETLSKNNSVAFSVGIFKQSMGARKLVGIGLRYRPARLHRQVELIPRNKF